MLGSLGLSLRDVEAFAVKHPNGLFTDDVDSFGLWRNTPLGSTLSRAHDDIKQAAGSVKISTGETDGGFTSGIGRKQSGGEMER
jgi:hypothetical protein